MVWFGRSALAVILLLCVTAACDSAEPERTSSLTPHRLELLSKGINTSHWFAQTQLSTSRFKNYIQESDVRLIKEMGFRHIRLSLDPDVLFQEDAPAQLHKVNLYHLNNALDMVLGEGLGVIIDPHPKTEFKHRIRDEPEFMEKAAQFWGALAANMSKRDPEFLFLEVMNEPQINDPDQWQAVQVQLLAAMRENAPDHTLIATGPRFSGPDEIVKIEPVDDPNVVYNFHMYDPHHFTHQGASWGWERWIDLKGLPYPSSPDAVAPIIDDLPQDLHWVARNYGKERWNKETMEAHLQPVFDWAAEHDVELTCNEFGVYRKVAPVESRLAWIEDVRQVLEAHDVGWTMWDYAGGFSVVNVNDDEVRVPDEGTLEALGLE